MHWRFAIIYAMRLKKSSDIRKMSGIRRFKNVVRKKNGNAPQERKLSETSKSDDF
jgi:hypothetical protein